MDGYRESIGLRPAARAPFPIETRVRVEALTTTWCMDAVRVEVGNLYAVAEHEADRLVHLGKAKRV
jgi:hypothetical protein